MPPGAVIVEKADHRPAGHFAHARCAMPFAQLADERLVNIRPQSGDLCGADRPPPVGRRPVDPPAPWRVGGHQAGRGAGSMMRPSSGCAILLVLQARARPTRARHEDFIAYDDQFHQAISEMSGYSRLLAQSSTDPRPSSIGVRYLSSPIPHQEEKSHRPAHGDCRGDGAAQIWIER